MGRWGEGLRDRAHTSSIQLMAEVLFRGNGSRDLINAGLGPKTAFPNGILGGVYQTGVPHFLIHSFSPSSPCFFLFISSRLVCVLCKERDWCSELDLKPSKRPAKAGGT